MKMLACLALATAVFGASCAVDDDQDPAGLAESQSAVVSPDTLPKGIHGVWHQWGGDRGEGKPKGGGGGGHIASNGIDWHGGPVMLGTNHLYYIWYGNWAGNTAAQAILTDLANTLGGSPYFRINTSYNDGSGTPISSDLSLAGSTSDSYSLGSNLTDANIASVVAAAITSGRLPRDTSGIYLVLTSSDVTATSGFCSNYCGWHSHTTVDGADIKYGFIGNPDRCPASCASGLASPNGNAGADGMASIIAHETEEAITDPDLNAWFDRRGYENADKCAWTYGTTYAAANGGVANMKLGSRDFLIQRNWVNASGGYCAQAL
jgi:hypothetical protein